MLLRIFSSWVHQITDSWNAEEIYSYYKCERRMFIKAQRVIWWLIEGELWWLCEWWGQFCPSKDSGKICSGMTVENKGSGNIGKVCLRSSSLLPVILPCSPPSTFSIQSLAKLWKLLEESGEGWDLDRKRYVSRSYIPFSMFLWKVGKAGIQCSGNTTLVSRHILRNQSARAQQRVLRRHLSLPLAADHPLPSA